MFLNYLDQHCHKRPSQLSLYDFDTRLTLDFQDFLEAERGNGIRSRNARLAALRAFAQHEATTMFGDPWSSFSPMDEFVECGLPT